MSERLEDLKNAVFGRPETTGEKVQRQGGEAAEKTKETAQTTGEWISEKATNAKEAVVGKAEETRAEGKQATSS